MVPISIAEERKMENIPKQRGQCWIDYLLTRITDLIKIQEYERALHIAEQALLMLPDNQDIIYLASTIYQNLNKFVKELRLLERLRDIRPFDQDTRSALGRSLMFQGYYYSALSVMSHFDMMSNGLAGITRYSCIIARHVLGIHNQLSSTVTVVLKIIRMSPMQPAFLRSFVP